MWCLGMEGRGLVGGIGVGGGIGFCKVWVIVRGI